jgi:hypothetical protein
MRQKKEENSNDAHATPGSSDSLLVLFPFASSILVELLKVFNALFWSAKGGILPFLSLC